MCILLYVKAIQCSGLLRSLLGWRGSPSALGICEFCYMLNLFSVVVLHRSMVNWRREALVYVYSSICITYSV